MPYQYIKPIWKLLTPSIRMRVVRLFQPTFTVSSAAVVLNENDEVLLLDHLLRPVSGWGIPGGFIDKGEQPEAALHREIKEETGLALKDVRMIKVRTIGRHVEIIFAAKGVGEAQVLSREITEAKWFSLEGLPERLPVFQKQLIAGVLKGEI